MTTHSALTAVVAIFALAACSSDPTANSGSSGGANGNGTAGAAVGGTPGDAGGASQPTAGAGAGGSATGVAGGGGTLGGAANGGRPSVGGSGGTPSGGTSSGGTSSGGTSSGGAGQGGSSSGGSGGAGGKTDVKSSMGCSVATTQALNQWVDSMVMTGGANRPYSVRLPTGYDPKRAYPVVVLLHGCGSGTNNVPIEKASGADAILVRGTGSASGTCWDTSATGPDVAFFDAMVADVKARFCADEHRFFVVGYSSGSWLVNQLTCIRADVIRGGASVTGGESASGKCGGPVARIFIHDSDDTTNVISGSIKARDRQLTQNSCDKAAMAMPVDPSPCTLYQGCAAGYPVEWCQTSGQMHNRQDSLAPSLFWNFFKAL